VKSNPAGESMAAAFSVSALISSIRAMLSADLRDVWIAGEVGVMTRSRSGMLFFSMRDERSTLRACVRKAGAVEIPAELEEGQQVIVRGTLDVYAPRGDLQVQVQELHIIRDDGYWRRKRERAAAALRADGLLERQRKAVPETCAMVGVVASVSSAAMRDVERVIRESTPWVQLVLAHCAVQGHGAEQEIADAIRRLQTDAIDVILVVRGGGSAEDLGPFDSELVARAICGSTKPVVTGIGHDTDHTLADAVADLSAPTPSAAARTVSLSSSEIRSRLDTTVLMLQENTRAAIAAVSDRLARAEESHHRAVSRAVSAADASLVSFAVPASTRRVLSSISTLEAQLMGYGPTRMEAIARTVVGHAAARLELHNPINGLRLTSRLLLSAQQELERWGPQRLLSAMDERLAAAENEFRGLIRVVHTLSPLSTLSRGYALIQNRMGVLVRRASELEAGDRITLRLADATVQVVVESIHPSREDTHG
jgi:exodeoxyribonuclease VII large subunit